MDSFDFGSDFLGLKDTNNDGSIKKEMETVPAIMDTFHIQPLNASSLFSQPFIHNPFQFPDNNARLPLDLSALCKLSDLKAEIPYAVNYKIQDGKHVKIWECKTCGKEFGHQYTLMRHLPTHTDERKFQCTTCGKAFRQMSTLSQHRAIHSHERPYVCEVCKKTFNRVSTLISHRKTHTGVKPHQCHLCNKAFHQKGNLRNHIFTHTNERPYKCEDCGKGFNQMSNLMCHKLKSHQRVDKPKYFCQICGRNFSKRCALRNHEQFEHAAGVTDELDSTLGSEDSTLIDNERMNNAIFVEPIKTKAMQLALESNQIPFALLRPSTGIPVLVRVLSAGSDKQMLVPASAEDLKKHGQISVTPKTSGDEPNQQENLVGSTVQIKIPVVATVIQQSGEGGHMSMSVVSPGPGDQNAESQDAYIFNATSEEFCTDIIANNSSQIQTECTLNNLITSTAIIENGEIPTISIPDTLKTEDLVDFTDHDVFFVSDVL